ncbi:MAG TPA: hypothetical protein VKB93_02080 [Thermoanaerobaculia bacterium]|nr:hypothetical protein [Thermoanaerobaculia bacterium]
MLREYAIDCILKFSRNQLAPGAGGVILIARQVDQEDALNDRPLIVDHGEIARGLRLRLAEIVCQDDDLNSDPPKEWNEAAFARDTAAKLSEVCLEIGPTSAIRTTTTARLVLNVCRFRRRTTLAGTFCLVSTGLKPNFARASAVCARSETISMSER